MFCLLKKLFSKNKIAPIGDQCSYCDYNESDDNGGLFKCLECESYSICDHCYGDLDKILCKTCDKNLLGSITKYN